MLVAFLGLTGSLIWWPGSGDWRRNLAIDTKRGARRLNWSLHTALGIWFFLFVIMWGISGIYLSAPNAFHAAVDFVSPQNAKGERIGDKLLLWLSEAHFGRFGGLPIEIVWCVVAFIPVVLFVTGTLMWWNRVVRPWLWREPTGAATVRAANVSGARQA